MSYGKPLQLGLKQRKMFAHESRNSMGKMPISGINIKDDSQFLDTNAAINIENYLVYGIAKMQKRPGQTVNFNTTESAGITLNEEYISTYDIIAYGTKVRAFNNADGSFTDIKTNFTANNGVWTGGRYGDYFLVNNFLDGLWRISQILAYDAQGSNFTVGLQITGGTSGATATILQDADAGATGTLTLGNINGVFIDNEIITDTSSGTATVNGVLSFSIIKVSGAPRAKVFRIIGNRGILINLAKDKAAYNYSDADIGTNPPFSNWVTGTGYNDPGDGSYRNGGAALDCALIGDQIFIGQEHGWYAFKISQTTLLDGVGASVSAKFDQPVAFRQDFPVFKCKMTDIGMIAASSSGIWSLVSLGQQNIPYSEQWECLTNDLGVDFFNTVDFSNTDITYDTLRGFIYVTVGKDSSTNNLVLAIKADTAGSGSSVKRGATSFLKGWNILRFLVKESDIFGTSAVKGIRYNLFVGQKDVQAKIHSEYLQELNFGLTGAFKLEEFYAHGELSPASKIIVSFDTFDDTGFYKARRKQYLWQARYPAAGNGNGGWGQAGWDKNGWGGGANVSGLIEDFTGAKPRLRQLSRVYLRFESDDASEHIINWFTADANVTKQIRIRQLQIIP